MARTVLNISLLVLLASSCILTASLEASKDYDYYAFALEWPGSVCQFKNCVEDHSAPGVWNLHGLWPNADNGHHPFFCTKTSLDWLNLSEELRKELGLYWSGLYSSQEQFLDHEWTKHGTCWRTDYGVVSKMPSQIQDNVSKARNDKQNSADFFSLVVDLSKNVYNIYDILSSEGIVPSDSKHYTLEQIHSAITKNFGKGSVTKFKVNCQRDESGNSYFNDVLICLDKNYNPMDCRFSVTSKCPSSGIRYPPKKQHVDIKPVLTLF